jgi:hypothetical protein
MPSLNNPLSIVLATEKGRSPDDRFFGYYANAMIYHSIFDSTFPWEREKYRRSSGRGVCRCYH